jgi:aspartate/methionine/tyrosine aminotransferase
MNSANSVQASATVLINSLAQAKQAAGVKVFNLSAGEPKIATPKVIITAASEFIQQGEIFYPITAGIPQLRSLATQWVNSNYMCNYLPDECLVVPGGKFGLYLLFQHLLQLEAGGQQEVLIPAPYWVSYPTLTKLFGGIAKILPTQESEQWKITPEILANNCSKNSRLLVLNNAVNPTGAIYSREELAALLQVAKAKNLLVVADEVYSGLVYDYNSYVSCGSFPEYKDRVVVIQSTSKNFAMTGWRVGFVFAPINIIKPLTVLVSQSTSGVCPVSQYAVIAAMQHASEITKRVRNIMQQRRDIFLQAFSQTFDIKLRPPKSALYSLVALAQLGVSNSSAEEFCVRALEETNVALVPGDAFGVTGYVRFSFAAAEDEVVNGLNHLAQWCKRLNLGKNNYVGK